MAGISRILLNDKVLGHDCFRCRYLKAAAQLVGALAQSKDFREPDFDSPVLQNDNDGLETFTISITLKPAGAS